MAVVGPRWWGEMPTGKTREAAGACEALDWESGDLRKGSIKRSPSHRTL